ncbi:MAG TPA: CHRD domain-containing protein [Vicinamibacterales bacterium]|jgi:hypothetical protein|nr:CHRD domain-containing protein [Vicinamibacterales bacterium]
MVGDRIVRATLMACVTAVMISTSASTQGKTFKARLSVVPIDATMQATIAGTGSVSAALTGTKLSITGAFEGLRSPATIAQLHRAQRGVRGPVLQSTSDLQVTHGTSGTISGSIELTAMQITDLEQGRLYLQLHSEKAPDGNLWGWLLSKEGK